MLMVLVENRAQLKTLIGQILFRPEDETDGSVFEAELSVSEIQKFLQVNDDVLLKWLRDTGKISDDEFDAEDFVSGFFALDESLDVCDIETLKEYVLEHELSPLLSHFTPGLLYWEIEDHFDTREGATTSRTFQYTTLAELSFENHSAWYDQMQKDFKESNEQPRSVDELED